MTVYFDLENFKSLMLKYDASQKGADVLRFIKKQLNVHMNFMIKNLPEDVEDLLSEFMDGVSPDFRLTHSTNFVQRRPVSVDSLIDKNGIYLLDDENIEMVRNTNTVFIGRPGEEINVLERLILDKDDYGFHSQKVIGSVDFDDWNKIEPYCFPFSTLIIVDRYIFKGSATTGNLGLFDFNLGKILSKFFEHKKSLARIIVIYQIELISGSTGPDFTYLKTKFERAIKKLNNGCPIPEMFFISVPKGKIDDEHDRHIISNYIRFKSGDSLVYFSSAGIKLTMSKDFDIYSMANRNYQKNTKLLLDDIRKIIKDTHALYPFRCSFEDGIAKETIVNLN